jgi:lipoprotein-anchoring transpeptidase ErfK/SrfK
VDAIVRANGLPALDRVLLGQRLIIPAALRPPAELAPAEPAAGIAAPVPDGHRVQAGETLLAIAARYGTTSAELARLNGLASADRILVGQQLVLPGREPGTEAASAEPAVGGALAGPTSGRPLGPGKVGVVSLAEQRLRAYEGGREVASFVVSSGAPGTPTPLGRFAIYQRLESQRMVGPGYDLPGVPHVQYFTGSYAIHGAYWHNLFGIPLSHGCVNLRPGDATWLWGWAEIGTEVVVEP